MNGKRSLVLIVVSAIAISLLAVAFGYTQTTPTPSPKTQPKAIQWLGQNAYIGGASGGFGPFMVDWIKKATNGRLIIDLKPAGGVVPITDMFDAVSKGIIKFAGMHYAGYYPGKFPETDIEIGLPFAWQCGEDEWDTFFNRGLFKEIQQVYAEHNIKYFHAFCNTTYGIQATFPIKSLNDIKGKKIRAMGIYADYIKLLGGSPVHTPYPETYMALKLGTIDGALIGKASLIDAKLAEVVKYFLDDPNAGTCPANYLINMDAWNELPADIREMLDRDFAKVDAEFSNYEQVIFRDYLIKVQRDYDVKMVSLPEAEKIKIVNMVQPIWDKVAAKSPRCARLVEIVRKQMRDLGRIK